MRTTRRHASLALTATLALLGLANATTANADSIVYVEDGDVFLVNPDGTGTHQVTSSGTYWSPSQADDGTIVAVKDASPVDHLVRMNQAGQVLSEFVPAVAAANALNRLDDAAVSPDGSKVAYVTSWNGDSSCTPSGNGLTNCYVFAVSPSTGPGDLGHEAFRKNPSWIDGSTVLVETDFNRMATYEVGAANAVNWFGRDNTANPGPGDNIYDGEVSPAGDKVVTTAWEANTGKGFATSVVLWTTNGAPPSQPTPQCRISDAAGGKFNDPTWAPDGTAVAWEEGDLNGTNDPGPGEGIWEIDADVPATPCAQLQGGVLVPGGQEPDWGPADIRPPATTGAGGTTPGGGSPGTGTTGGGTGGGGGTTGGGGGGATVADTAGPHVTLSAAGAQKLRTVLKKGYKLSLTTDEAGSAEATLVASGSAARGLKPAKTVTVGKGSKTFAGKGKQILVLKFTAKARKKLARKRSVKLQLRVTVRDGAGNKTTQTRKVTLKR